MVPRDDVAQLTEEQRSIYDRAAGEYDTSKDRMRLLAYLHDCWDEDIAHERMEDLAELMRTTPVPTPSQVCHHYYEDEQGRPSPCLVLLEDGQGGCARARDGSPIVVCFGGLPGDSADMMRQMGFVFARCDRYFADTEMPRVTFVTDLLARKGTHETRAPDMTVGNFLMKFPLCFRALTCGVEPWMERAAEAAAKASGVLMPAGLQEKYQLSAGYDILEAAIDPSQMLPSWHPQGAFVFHLPAYAAYLTKE